MVFSGTSLFHPCVFFSGTFSHVHSGKKAPGCISSVEAFRMAAWIPFGDHPLRSERCRED